MKRHYAPNLCNPKKALRDKWPITSISSKVTCAHCLRKNSNDKLFSNLSYFMWDTFLYAFEKWINSNPSVSYLDISHQLYSVGGKLCQLGFDYQEEYRKIHGK